MTYLPVRVFRAVRALPAVRALFVVVAAIGAVLGGAAAAQADDDVFSNTFRLGSYTVFYHTNADDLSGPYVPGGVNLKAQNLETLYAAYVRRLSEHFVFELALGWPPLTKTVGQGPATLGSVPFNNQVISTARWFAPTALLNYQFFDDSAKLRPYIGIGVNYVNFYDRDSTAEGDAASGGPTKISLAPSVGPAGTVGLAYRLAPHWGLFASYGIARVDTRLFAYTDGVVRTTHISFGPQSLILSAGYSF